MIYLSLIIADVWILCFYLIAYEGLKRALNHIQLSNVQIN